MGLVVMGHLWQRSSVMGWRWLLVVVEIVVLLLVPIEMTKRIHDVGLERLQKNESTEWISQGLRIGETHKVWVCDNLRVD